MIDVDAREDRAIGIDDVDRIEAAAEPDLEHQRVERARRTARRMASVVNSK